MAIRLGRIVACSLMLHVSWPVTLYAQQATPAAEPQAAAQTYNTEQLDALLAPIALYPDPLLTQTLMAATNPLQVVEAQRWLEVPANKALTGDALSKALEAQSWDPSVKSLVPFPQVLAMMNGNLDWMQQLGYAFAEQQADVLDSVQRLRQQAQSSGNLQSTPQQTVTTQQQTIVIEPAQANVVYVPNYNPAAVYGAWPYPSYPPVYLPPPVGYPVGTALATGLAFGVGVAVTAGLWNWARPVWGGGGYRGGYVNVNVNRYNNINVNRTAINSNRWQANRPGGRPAGMAGPPRGPVGAPARPGGLPAGAIGRPQVSVPGSAVRPPGRPGGGAPPNLGNRPGGGTPPNLGNRPGGGTPPNLGNRPGGGTPPNLGNRPGGGTPPNLGNRPATQPARPSGQGAFSGIGNGREASQFGERGAQSCSAGQVQRPAGGGGGRTGGGHAGGGRRR